MLKFRPHHFLCTLGFRGKGYSQEFVKNMQHISEGLFGLEGDWTQIQVVGEADDLCGACPNCAQGSCCNEDKVDRLDTEHARILGIKPGERITWGEIKKRLSQKMTPEEFHTACASCEWYAAGYCRQALNALRGDHHP